MSGCDEEQEPVDRDAAWRASVPALGGDRAQASARTRSEPRTAAGERRAATWSRLAEALHVHPHAGEQRERQADVQEDEEREQAVGHLRAERRGELPADSSVARNENCARVSHTSQ